MRILGLHGLPRSGKDTVAEHLIECYRARRISFADPLKQAAAILLNRPLTHCYGEDYDREAVMPEWGFSMRDFLQRMGTEVVREFSPDFWITRFSLVVRTLPFNTFVVIPDVRFPNEVAYIRSLGGVLVEIVRPGVAHNSHVSNQRLDLGTCSQLIINDGSIADLHMKVDGLVHSSFTKL